MAQVVKHHLKVEYSSFGTCPPAHNLVYIFLTNLCKVEKGQHWQFPFTLAVYTAL